VSGLSIPSLKADDPMIDRLASAISIAEAAHAGQTDKAGRPYIEHVLAVVAGVDTTDEKIVAALHDVLEDCPVWSVDRLLAEGISPELVRSVVAMTRQAGETYEAFVRRVRADPIARRVKRADLRHNMDLGRLATVTDTDRARLERYRQALAILAD
jgi:(p)ppGpp synthase/HD superfamily hydrolase